MKREQNLWKAFLIWKKELKRLRKETTDLTAANKEAKAAGVFRKEAKAIAERDLENEFNAAAKAREEANKILAEANAAAAFAISEAQAEVDKMLTEAQEKVAAADTYAKAIRELAANNPLGN